MVDQLTISIDCRQAKSIAQFATKLGRNYGQMYFHQVHGKYNLRTIGVDTNVDWLKQEISAGRIYLPTEKITAEKS